MNYILRLSRKLSGDRNAATSKIFLLLNIVAGLIGGYLIWLIASIFVGKSIIWLICALGYMAVFYGMLGGILYLMNKNLW